MSLAQPLTKTLARARGRGDAFDEAVTPPFEPGNLASLGLWLDASDSSTITLNTNKITQWDDKSGNGRHFTQGTDSIRPTVVSSVINTLDVARFDGTQIMSNATYSLPEEFSIFAVAAKASPSTGYQRMLTATDDGVLFFGMVDGDFTTLFGGDEGGWISTLKCTPATAVAATPAGSILGVVKPDDDNRASLTTTPYVDGTAMDLIAGDYLQATAGVYLSDPAGFQHFVGDIGEIQIYHGLLNTTQRQKVEGYLAHKWGLTGNLPGSHPYKTTPP